MNIPGSVPVFGNHNPCASHHTVYETIIDVRPTAAHDAGHIPTALSFPSSETASRLNELPLNQYLIVQSETGVRTQTVIQDVLEPNGYTRFMNWGRVTRWTNTRYACNGLVLDPLHEIRPTPRARLFGSLSQNRLVPG